MNDTNRLSLAVLKKLTIEAKDLNEPFNYFFEMTEQPGFTKQQRAIPRAQHHQTLELVLMAITNSISSITKEAQIEDKFFFKAPEYQFLHGTCLLKNNPAHVAAFYFSDIQTGLIAYVDTSFKTELFRFSLAEQQPIGHTH